MKIRWIAGVKTGAVNGGFRFIVGQRVFPVAGILTGAAAGGRLANGRLRCRKSFVKEASESMTENSSALFVIIRDSDPDLALAALRPMRRQSLQTTLDPEDEETPRRALHNGDIC